MMRQVVQRVLSTRRWRVAVVLLLAGLMPVRAAEDGFPGHKPGLWEIDRDGYTDQHCIDAEVDQMQERMARSLESQRPACSRRDMQRSGDTMTIDTDCPNALGETVKGHTVITGSFESAYALTYTTDIPSHMTVLAKRLGACADGQKPGDVIVNGVKTHNILELGKIYLENRKSIPGQDVPPPAK
jgi:hypothetical protein